MKSDAAILGKYGIRLSRHNAPNPATIMGDIAAEEGCTTLEVTKSLLRSAHLITADFDFIDSKDSPEQKPLKEAKPK